MIFRKQVFLGQVPFSTMGRITSGASTYTAQNLCKLLKQEKARPGSVSQKQISEEWGRVSGVKEMEDDTKYHMNAWCPESIALLDQVLTQPYKVYQPEPAERTAHMAPPPEQFRKPQKSAPVSFEELPQEPRSWPLKPPIKTSMPIPPKPPLAPWRGFTSMAPPTPPQGAPVATPSNTYRQQMTREQLIRSALTLQPSGGGMIQPVNYAPQTYGQMPMMTGSRRIRVDNLGGSREDLAWFEANRIQIAAQYPNQFVIVKDLAVRGAFPDFQSAYNAGVAQFGTQSFEIKQATVEQRTEIA